HRELYSAWSGRVGANAFIPSEKVQQLFNDMQLYPSKSDVLEMLRCAQQCAQRSTPNYLTFGEFCVFATELRRCVDKGYVVIGFLRPSSCICQHIPQESR
ncbi:Octanoyl-[GcvH]:protein N-octanoyltransferase, partial [Frankliniella fusca]